MGKISTYHFIIDTIPKSIWQEADEISRERNNSIYDSDWIHDKGYLWNEPNDGSHEQVDKYGNIEVPYERELFYPSPGGRYSLGEDVAVAYFSNEWIINRLETDGEIKNKKMSYSEYVEYQKIGSRKNKYYHYLVHRTLMTNSKILNLKSKENPIINWIQKKSSIDGVRIEYDIPFTQTIARASYVQGFQGIVYKSIQSLTNMSTPNANLVVFNRDTIINSTK